MLRLKRLKGQSIDIDHGRIIVTITDYPKFQRGEVLSGVGLGVQADKSIPVHCFEVIDRPPLDPAKSMRFALHVPQALGERFKIACRYLGKTNAEALRVAFESVLEAMEAEMVQEWESVALCGEYVDGGRPVELTIA